MLAETQALQQAAEVEGPSLSIRFDLRRRNA
jgi:hypothetical protein